MTLTAASRTPVGAVLGASLVIGLTKGAAQYVLLREFLQLADGNELTLGIYLLIWMGAEAVGSWLGGRKRPGLEAGPAAIQLGWTHLLIAAVVVGAIVTARAVPLYSALRYGEALGLRCLLAAAVALAAPLVALGGYQFSLAVWAASRAGQGSSPSSLRSPGLAYAWEAAGHAVGAVLGLAAILAGRSGLDTVIWLAAINLAAGAVLLWPGGRAGKAWAGLLAAASAVLVVWPVAAGGWVARADLLMAGWRWPAQEVVYVAESPYARLTVARRDGQLTYYSHGSPEGFLPGPDPVVQLHTHRAMLAHPDPQAVLVIGGVLGGSVSEAGLHRPRLLQYVALDRRLLDVIAATQAPPGTGDQAWRDLEVLRGSQVVVDDPRAVVAAARDRFDVILLSPGEPGSLRVNRLLTVEFFRAARRALADGGVLAVPLVVSPPHPDPELAAAAHSVRRAMEVVFGPVAVLGTEHATLLAFRTPPGPLPGRGEDLPLALGLTPARLAERAGERRVDSFAVYEAFWRMELDPVRLASVRAATEMPRAWEFGQAVNSDRRPLAVFFSLARWHTMHHPGARPAWQALWRATGLAVAALLVVLAALTAAGYRRRAGSRGPGDPEGKPPPGRRRIIALATGSVGFMAMVSHMLLLLMYQAYAGYLYRDAGILSAGFMVSLVAGARLGLARAAAEPGTAGRRGRLAPSLVAGMWAVYLAALLLGLAAYRPAAATLALRAGLAAAVSAGGLLTGLFFPAALGSLRDDNAAGGAALLYGCDLMGGAIGALLAAPVLLPALGQEWTIAALAAAAALVWLNLRRLEQPWTRPDRTHGRPGPTPPGPAPL